jgi:hypothetical protein
MLEISFVFISFADELNAFLPRYGIPLAGENR